MPRFVRPLQALAALPLLAGLATLPALANDACSDALEIGKETVHGTTQGAARGVPATCDTPDGSPDVWFRVQAETDGQVFFNTFGSDFDTLVSVHTECPGAPANEILCTDNRKDSILQSEGHFEATAGASYWIRVSGYGGAFGRFRLQLGDLGGLAGTVTDAETGLGVAQARIVVVDPLSDVLEYSAITDETGAYHVPDLPAGPYVVHFPHNSRYMAQRFPGERCAGASCTPHGAQTIDVELNRVTGGIDFALQRGGAMSGTVLDRASGQPVADVEITLRTESTPGTTYLTDFRATTGVDGRFLLAGLPSGTYYARTENTLGYSHEVFDSLPCEASYNCPVPGAPIEVSEGSVVEDIDFTLDRLSRVSGQVIDRQTREGIAFIQIRLYDFYAHRVDTQWTDENGRFQSAGLYPGPYEMVAFSRSRYRSEVYDDISCEFESECQPIHGTPLDVVLGSDIEDLIVELDPWGTLEGRLTRTEDGAPIEWGHLAILNEDGDFEDGPISDSEGNYRSSGLPDGTYYVTLEPTHYRAEAFEDVPCDRGCDLTQATPLQVSVGEMTSGVDFELDRFSTLSGRLTDKRTGEVIAGEVFLFGQTGGPIAQTSSDAEGYAFTQLQPGTYFLTANSPFYNGEGHGDLPCPDNTCRPTDGTPIVMDFNRDVAVDFALTPRPTGRVTGSVAARRGEPTTTSVHFVQPDGTLALTVPDIQGAASYRVEKLAPGTYYAVAFPSEDRFAAQVFGGAPCEPSACHPLTGTPIEIREGETTSSIDFVLEPWASASGIVRDTLGAPLAGVEIRLVNDSRQITTLTDETGRYVLEGIVIPESYQLVASLEDYLSRAYPDVSCGFEGCGPTAGQPIEFTDLGEERGDLDLTLERGGALSGRVFSTESHPTSSYFGKIIVYDSTGQQIAEAEIDRAGRYRLGGLPSGTYFLRSRLARFQDEIYDNIPCLEEDCDPTVGAPIHIRTDEVVQGLDFRLLRQGTSPCEPSASNLCLNGGRFSVHAAWRKENGPSPGQLNSGQAQLLTDDSGYFWFFEPSNVELIVKVLDGCFEAQNTFWIFAAGLTDVEVLLTVTDHWTGDIKTYTNRLGNDFQPILDTTAFDTCANEPGKTVAPPSDILQSTVWPEPTDSTTCTPSATEHCLNQGRFRVWAEWSTTAGTSELARTGPSLEDTGFFWFFNSENIEIAVKILDACTLDLFNNFWVFAAGLTDVEVTLFVEDTQTGDLKIYFNPQGVPFAPVQDTRAFDTCSDSGS